MRTGTRVWTTASVAALVLSVLAGCWSYQPGDPARLASVPVSALSTEAWPARDSAVLEELSRLTPRSPTAVERTDRPASLQSPVEGTTREDIRRRVMKVDVTHNKVYGQGLLRVFAPKASTPAVLRTYEDSQRETIGFVPNARFLTSRVLDDVRIQLDRERRQRIFRATEQLQMAAAVKGGSVNMGGGYDTSLLQFGMPIEFPPAFESPPKGVIIHLHSIAPNPFEPRVVESFRRRGWAVVTLNTSTGIKPPFSPEQEARYRELDEARTRIVVGHIERVTEQVRGWEHGPDRPMTFKRSPQDARELTRLGREIDKLTKQVRYHIERDADVETVGRVIASETDQALASNAYAVEAVLEYLNAERPDLAPKAHNIPVVIVGMSAGALAAPAAAVRVRDQIAAVVLVGGGADLFRISQESTLTDGGIEIFRGKRRVPRSVREQIDAAYLTATRLDPYHTAPLLAGLPVLQVHAYWDGWVPEETGEMLYARLGRPDRIGFLGGHSTLFLFLPGRSGQIMDWIEGVTIPNLPHQ